MFEELYSKDDNSAISKEDFNLLYEEYKKTQQKYEKLERRFNLIIKQSDRTLRRNTSTIESHVKTKKRFYTILKQGDKQGLTLLKSKYNLEETLETELKKEQELTIEVEDTQKEMIYLAGTIGEFRSKETANHVRRVAYFAKILAYHYGLNKDDIELITEASPMHDIGKVAISDTILHKPGKLTEEEFCIMKEHTTYGYEILQHSKMPVLQAAAIIAQQHHEKYDGTGYPYGLKGEAIHIFGRIVAMVDVFDALGSVRSYKDAWADEKILQYFQERKGKQFDPDLVDILFDNIDQFFTIRKKFKDT